MKTHHARTLMFGVFAITLCAGVVAGLLAAKLPAVQPKMDATNANDAAPLAEQLSLTVDQREKMRGFWEGVRDLSQNSYDGARKAESERDQAVVGLIPAEKMPQYNAIMRRYAETCASMEGKRKAAFDKAVRDTQRILTDAQRRKYDEILKKRGVAFPENGGHEALGEPAS